MTRGFKANDMSHKSCHPHTFSVLVPALSLPVCSRCQWCQGASVCSVTTVIVKQRVHGGPLLLYSQKAVGWREALLYSNTLPAFALPSPFSHLPPGHIMVQQHNVRDVTERLNKAYTGFFCYSLCVLPAFEFGILPFLSIFFLLLMGFGMVCVCANAVIDSQPRPNTRQRL